LVGFCSKVGEAEVIINILLLWVPVRRQTKLLRRRTEVTPIRSVDRISVGSGGRGEITEKIQSAFFEITKGERKAPGDWLTYVKAAKTPQASNNGSLSREEPRQESEKGVEVTATANRQSEPVMKYQTAANTVD